MRQHADECCTRRNSNELNPAFYPKIFIRSRLSEKFISVGFQKKLVVEGKPVGGNKQTVTTFEVRDHVARVSLNRPEAMNSMNPDLRWELSQHWDEVEANDDIWVAVITGAGERAFSAGADLKHRAQVQGADEAQRAKWQEMALETTSLVER